MKLFDFGTTALD